MQKSIIKSVLLDSESVSCHTGFEAFRVRFNGEPDGSIDGVDVNGDNAGTCPKEDSMARKTGGAGSEGSQAVVPASLVTVTARPDRAHVPVSGGERFLDTEIRVAARPVRAGQVGRLPVAIGIVIDRSGSMGGGKIETAKAAALAVIDQLRDGDEIAITIFDNHIEVLQPRVKVTPEVRRDVRRLLAGVHSRGGTALHAGWLDGCRALANGQLTVGADTITRCFLLTDGQANEGVTDIDLICQDVAGVREHARITTSTFGIGDDYAEELLQPMAVAGGGQFHHLRNPEEIARTFLGELGEVFEIAASAVALEFEVDARATVEVVSEYWTGRRNALVGSADGPRQTLRVEVGDLTFAEVRHVVLALGYPAQAAGAPDQLVRVRGIWRVPGGDESASPWQDVRYVHADEATCDADVIDPAVARWVGEHLIERTRKSSSARSKRGDLSGVLEDESELGRRLGAFVVASPQVEAMSVSYEAVSLGMRTAPMSEALAKEAYFRSARVSRGQRDFRGGIPGGPTRPGGNPLAGESAGAPAGPVPAELRAQADAFRAQWSLLEAVSGGLRRFGNGHGRRGSSDAVWDGLRETRARFEAIDLGLPGAATRLGEVSQELAGHEVALRQVAEDLLGQALHEIEPIENRARVSHEQVAGVDFTTPVTGQVALSTAVERKRVALVPEIIAFVGRLASLHRDSTELRHLIEQVRSDVFRQLQVLGECAWRLDRIRSQAGPIFGEVARHLALSQAPRQWQAAIQRADAVAPVAGTPEAEEFAAKVLLPAQSALVLGGRDALLGIDHFDRALYAWIAGHAPAVTPA
ncbi:MAG: VWA domain-containing protein [Proteobacteria bacterium]|nr:VWA domain-containing protein [Pseudomonadota bacterium]NBY48751.1 VWA domain-containing protein [Pseudomonadota bacterium]